ncbi:hypothetical protein, partial [Xanthomonas vasicola]|uniref:hypothetical protein n=1 Tax=Xanthomonas vasicola TaxID=56459 RepID=UPI001D0C9EA8
SCACNPGNTPQTCRNRQKIGDLSALSAADAVASFSGRVDQTILRGRVLPASSIWDVRMDAHRA